MTATIEGVAADFEVSPESVRRWMCQVDIDDGFKGGLTMTVDEVDYYGNRLDVVVT